MTNKTENSPLTGKQMNSLHNLIKETTSMEHMWMSGYLSALAAQSVTSVLATDAETSVGGDITPKRVTLLFGSQTGNSEALAEEFTEKLQNNHYHVTLASMDAFDAEELSDTELLLVIVSTQGEGEPPDTAIPFHEFLYGQRAPELEHLQYSVLALGDSSYEDFCHTGKDFDKQLAELGATALTPIVTCDLDFDESATEWFDATVLSLNEITKGAGPGYTDAPDASNKSQYSRKNPFQAIVNKNINLNKAGSNKETRHLEISLKGSDLTYKPGDSIGMYPENNALLVDAIIEKINWDPNEVITVNKQGDSLLLRNALLHYYDITTLTKPLMENIALFTTDFAFHELLKNSQRQALEDYMYGRDVLDLFTDFTPWNAKAAEFIPMLRKIPPRLYSIASSLAAQPDSVHLTVAVVNYELDERMRSGVCSTQLANQIEPEDTVSIYVHKNNHFKLPEDGDTPIIMIGPGTGIAPFRGFLAERAATEAKGDTWLFFGDQHYQTDYLYQADLETWTEAGLLTELDCAFSRDTAEKIYVQHRMLEKASELYKWIQAGAVIYVCGDEEYMAKDVHQALLTILETEGKLSKEDAAGFLKQAMRDKRYLRDVY